jgi:predicted permease
MNKKGEENIAEPIIFIILNLIVFFTLLVFVANSSDGKYMAEQYYAKQIASFINEASPGMNLLVNMEELFEDYEKDFKSGKIQKEDILKIDNENGIVYFSLNQQTAYSYRFFNNVKVISSVEGNYLKMRIEVSETA